MSINRRQALQAAGIFLGTAISSPILAIIEGKKTYFGKNYQASAAEILLLAEMAETIIPTTDTPGAKAADVHQFIQKVIKDCYSLADQNKFYESINDFDKKLKSTGKSFTSSTEQEKIAALKQLHKDDPEFFKRLKELTVTGYFTSEIGATMALAYLPIPGKYEGCLPLTNGQKAWAL